MPVSKKLLFSKRKEDKIIEEQQVIDSTKQLGIVSESGGVKKVANKKVAATSEVAKVEVAKAAEKKPVVKKAVAEKKPDVVSTL